MHATLDSHNIGNLIVYSTGLLVCLLLLTLTLRAARFPGTPISNVAFALCGVLWTAGGLVYNALAAAGHYSRIPIAVQYTGAIAVPIPVLLAWRPRWRPLPILAAAAALPLALLLWLDTFPLNQLKTAIAAYAAATLLLGFATSTRGARPVVYVPSAVIAAAGLCALLLSLTRVHNPTVYFLLSHTILFAVLCAFFLFARFRYADLFLRYAVRIVLAGTLAASLISAAGYIMTMPGGHASVHIAAILLFANIALLSLTFLDNAISRQVLRWLFRAPDYRAETRALAERLSLLATPDAIADAVADAARRPLDLASARIDPAPDLPALLDGELVERDLDVLVPIHSAGRVRHALRAEPGPERPALVSRDLDYLRAIAAQCGNRFDALDREREAIDRQSREAVLQQQVAEAELRALRAQINPHFLFNSLNTIADLTARDPARAETMTVRLASVFRHVLAHSARPLTTVRDEIAFLRTYLYIEEVRFGDRLQTQIEVAPEVETAAIPSLILQPLVENALKHGLAPKPGPGHLWISATAEGADLHLVVEDDGLGPSPSSTGTGLANIADRLRTLYQDRATVTLAPRDPHGARATLTLPLTPPDPNSRAGDRAASPALGAPAPTPPPTDPEPLP